MPAVISERRRSILRCVAAVAAPALVASAMLLATPIVPGSSETVLAKDKPKTCQKKREDCQGRCNDRYPTNLEQIHSCLKRTCNKQHDNCVKDQGTKPSKNAPPEKPPMKGEGVPPTGGVKEPKSPPKNTGTRAPSFGTFSNKQSPGMGGGGGGPILRGGGQSGGGKR